ncbi:DUF3040 domain-containing protein [Paenarthrobacter sp. NPDC090522]|uniref:DUF3040 domain-containing protein n=1 Tax=Paenarthrobacter sp. NPDC090522 TaxID=3364383 RepID=UPI0038163222
MPLSDQERRVLEQLERQLFIEDPALARRLESGKIPHHATAPKALNVVAVILGVALILLAIPIYPSPLGFLGFVLLASGVTAHYVQRRKERRRRGSA